ncbi:hypothetical protein ACNFH5_18875 [Pseudomonas sp. NY15435]|uniref:hypothetical protein n=1 Tax=Pseudomonas sp. NY15435 TaxID=3400358 RepID=UPI003A893A2A
MKKARSEAGFSSWRCCSISARKPPTNPRAGSTLAGRRREQPNVPGQGVVEVENQQETDSGRTLQPSPATRDRAASGKAGKAAEIFTAQTKTPS